MKWLVILVLVGWTLGGDREGLFEGRCGVLFLFFCLSFFIIMIIIIFLIIIILFLLFLLLFLLLLFSLGSTLQCRRWTDLER